MNTHAYITNINSNKILSIFVILVSTKGGIFTLKYTCYPFSISIVTYLSADGSARDSKWDIITSLRSNSVLRCWMCCLSSAMRLFLSLLSTLFPTFWLLFATILWPPNMGCIPIDCFRGVPIPHTSHSKLTSGYSLYIVLITEELRDESLFFPLKLPYVTPRSEKNFSSLTFLILASSITLSLILVWILSNSTCD